MIAFVMLPIVGNAKKIKFGNYITYDGKVENGLPKGEGKLIIVNNDPDVKKNAIVEGTFDGWTVGNDLPASVYFYSKDFFPFFRGKTEIMIADDGSSVSFKLISGDFIDRAEGIQFHGITNYDIVMTCTPKEDGIYISSTPFVMVKEIKDKKESKYAEKYLNLPSGKFISRCTCQYGGGKNNVKKSNFNEEIVTDSGSKYVLSENTITWITNIGSFVYKNNDYSGDWRDKILSFSKQILEGTLNYNDGILTLTDLQGHKHTVLYYDSHSKTIKEFEQYYLFEVGRNTLSKQGLKIIEGTAYTAAKNFSSHPNTKDEFQLGLAFLKGDGVEIDEKEAYIWIDDAYKYGGKEAIEFYKTKPSGINVGYASLESKEDKRVYSTYYDVNGIGQPSLGEGTLLHKNNGIFQVKNGKMVFTMKDGRVFEGYFKEGKIIDNPYKVFADRRLEDATELTPWQGIITSPDGTTDELKDGKSETERIKNEQAAFFKAYTNAKNSAKKLGSKYGATLVNNLINTGEIELGTPLAFIQEYISVHNSYYDNWPLQIKYYEPSIRDMMQYGKAAKSVKIFDKMGLCYSLMIANGKVVAIYNQSKILKIEQKK